MSKIQSKLNFLEKKKTSIRLQEKFEKNKIKEYESKVESTVCEREINKLYDKENELKVKLLCRKNPTVLIYRSPIKSERVKSILDSRKKQETAISHSKVSFKSEKEMHHEINTLESQDSNLRDQNIKNSRSPLKERSVCSATPSKLSNHCLRKTSKNNQNILYDVNSEEPSTSNNNQISEISIQERLNIIKSEKSNAVEQHLVDDCESLEKEKLIRATPTKQRSSYCLRNSPTKNKASCDDVKENVKSTIKLSPLKRQSPIGNGFQEESSPPKQICTQEGTPSQLITKLALESPQKSQDFKSRKELFSKGQFDEACKALHSSAPVKLPGREDKLEFIKGFLAKHAATQSSGALYISGPPGTGKTASINLAISDSSISDQYKVVCLNCTCITSTGSIYSRIVSELKLKILGHSERAALSAIEKYFESSKRKMILIVLDELDQLCSTKQSVLYSVFEWPARKNSRLVLIGIANALDLTDRVLPRLQAHLTLQPSVLHFPSYTRQQIIDIIADRLTEAGVEAVFSKPTLQLLAGKVAAVNGDVRRALDIARRVVEVAEKRSVTEHLADNSSRRQTVALQEVMAVINDVYSTSQTLDSSESDSFPLQQKLLICSVLLIRQTSKTKDVTVGKLHEVYKKVCDRRNLTALDISEFISLMPLVEARGILRVTGKSHNRLSKVILQWDEGEVKNTLRDKQLLAAVLSDKGIV